MSRKTDVKIAKLLNAFGEEANELYDTVNFDEGKKEDYEKVLAAFKKHFKSKN